MNLFTLLWSNLRFKPLTGILNVVLLALGLATILTFSHLERQASARFTRDLTGIDLVVSGKGSPLQIILSTVFHLDIPTGNISVHDAETLSRNRLVKTAIPLALGDNYQGFRIVGTTPDYIQHYQGQLVAGKMFSSEMDVVVGAEVAQLHQLKIGDHLIGAHGLVNSSDLHSDSPYTVTGILAPTQSVIDRLVLTPVASVWHVHEHPDADEADAAAEHKEHEYTALLITYASPMAAATLPRQINHDSRMQAASPAFEMARLFKLIGTGTDLLSAFGLILACLAGFGFFVTLSNAIHERLHDLALFRILGASRRKIFSLILSEALLLGGIGTLLGIILTWVFLQGAAAYIMTTRHVALPAASLEATDLKIMLAGLALSLVAGIIPAWRAYRLTLVEILKKT